VGSVFAAFLGFNPVRALLGPDVISALPADQAARITGQRFFPNLISAPVHSGLVVVFLAAAGLALVAAVASALRGDRYVHADNQVTAVVDDPAVTEVPVPPVAADASAEQPVAADSDDPARTSDDPARPPGAPVSARLAP
jgi:hypothetical protein